MFGKFQLTGHDKIFIKRDKNGIPQVEARHEADLYLAMGYCHAMDRGLQMLIMRILGRGQASEFLDSGDEMLEIDKFFRKMNFYGKTDQEIVKLSLEAKILCTAYCEGVNKFFERKIPWELRLLGYKPDPWKLEDSLLISRMIGFLTLSQSQQEIERLIVEMVQAGISKEKLDELFPDILEGLDEELLKKVKLAERIVPEALIWGSMVPRAMASNNWVIAGNRTESGKPLLANDPHLETNRLPNVWYEISLNLITKGRYAIAATMPGLPGLLVGRNNNLAWGATYTFMDSIDSWVEHCKDGKYLKDDGSYVPFRQRREIIRRKKKPEQEVVFYENERGILEGNPFTEGYYLSTRWTGGATGARSMSNMFRMWNAVNVEEGMKFLGEVETSWNWVFADAQGNIGYQMSGVMPKRDKKFSGMFPVPGWEKENNWMGFENAEKLPRCLNPKEGYIVTANHNLNYLGKVSPINISMGNYRAERISELIEKKDKHTVSDSFEIHYDLYSVQARKFMEIIRPLLPDTPQGKTLNEWDYTYTPESQGAYLFEKIYHALLNEVFGKNGFGDKVCDFLDKESGLFIDFYDNFDKVLLSKESKWFGDSSRDLLYRKIIENALNTVPKPWKENQKLMLTNIFFGGKLPRFIGIDKGPIILKGGRATPHQGQIYRSAGRLTSFAPSFRFVTELVKNEIHSNMAGGPSDRPFSRWYASGLKGWLNGKYKKIIINDGL